MTTDLLQRAAELVAVPSESFEEAVLVDRLEAELRGAAHLEVDRVNENLVARTTGDRPTRVILAGHTDTVPANGNAVARIDGDTLWGLGSADMKGGLAVMLELALQRPDPAVEVSYVFYAREEVAAVHSGLAELFELRPDLLEGDVAILGEPTDGHIEAGCQGTLRLQIVLHGRRAHTAWAWKGDNAVHRAAPLLAAIGAYQPRQPELAGCQYHEALQVVRIEGGVAGNVVPDRIELDLAHRYAPDRDEAAALAEVHSVIDEHLDGDDEVHLVDGSPAAAPAVEHPCIAALIGRHELVVRAKLGWTDVARFASHGVPAVNLGPGESSLAHTADERLERDSIERTFVALDDLISNGP